MPSIEELRKGIDGIDTLLLQTLAQRFALVKELGKVKKDAGLPIENKAREEEILQQRRELFQQLRGEDHQDREDHVFVEQLFMLLFKKSKELQQ